MFVILGATGHVGSATAEALVRRGEKVIAVTRDATKGAHLKELGAEIAEADLEDVEQMRSVFNQGTRLFLLNPPAAPNTDTDAVEKETGRLLLEALNGSRIEKVVLQSTYGAQEGHHLGDLNTLYALEQGLQKQSVPFSVLRAAYYMSNWDMMLEPAQKDGVLPTMYPANLKIPMVAPADLGEAAAALLLEPVDECGIHYVEGPARYSSGDVASAFAKVIGKPVKPVVTPREAWEEAYLGLGFSEPAARSYARMTAVSVDEDFDMPTNPQRGTVTLETYVGSLASRT